MAQLKGSKTHQNLKEAFAGESQANRRYLYFAKHADIEGRPDIAGLFRDTAEGETGHVVTDGNGRVRSMPPGFAELLLSYPVQPDDTEGELVPEISPE